jgi:hypothetical protein
LASSPDIFRMNKSRKVRWAGHKHERRKRIQARRRRRPEDNIKIGLRVIVWSSIHWIHLAQDSDQ